MTNEKLLELAKTACDNAYSPYSGFKVGCALLSKNGEVFVGCNIENASYSATVCAERVAFGTALAKGEKEFSKMAVVGIKNGEIQTEFYPCGVCLQFIGEFCDENFEIIMPNTTKTLGEMLPFGFRKGK